MSQVMKNRIMFAVVVSLTTMVDGVRAEDAETAAASSQIARSQVDRSSMQWIEKQKIRAAYMHRWSDPGIPDKVGAAGFNTLHIQFCNAGYGDIERWSRLAHENGLRFFTGLWWSYPPHRETRTGQASGIGQRYRGFVHASGRTLTRTVCPIDQAYWADWVTPGFIEMAKRAKDAAIYGITLDPEFYGSEEPDGGGNYGWYNWAGACYCDHCFGGFVRSVDQTVSAAEVPKDERVAWIGGRNKHAAYDEYLKTHVQKLARQIEQAVHQLDPHVLLGFLSVYDSSDFFTRGLLDGFKTPDRPVTVWPETPTYNKGYHPYVDQVYSKLKTSGAVYIPGFYLDAHSPMTIARQVHDLAMHSDGYWVFTRMKDLLLSASIGRQFKSGNQNIANAAPTSDEAPFLDLWESYESVVTLPAKCQLRLDPDDVGLVEKWYATDAQTDSWQGAKIGEFWDDLLGQPFEGVGWYRMTLQVPAGAAEKRLHLVFAAVDEEAWVWVNGEPAGEHAEGPEGWNKRFMIEVTNQIRPGQNNLIAVRVNNTKSAGGIWKPVRLIAEK